jgi:Mind bomb SH3 repeat domain
MASWFASESYTLGNVVRIRDVSVAEAEASQAGHGGLIESMKKMLGREGWISSIDDDGDLHIFVNNKRFCWNRELIEFVSTGAPHLPILGKQSCSHLYYCGRKVGEEYLLGSNGHCGPENGPQCKECLEHQARNSAHLIGKPLRIRKVSVPYLEILQKGHGGVNEEMLAALGQEGKLESVDDDGDFRVSVGDGKAVCWNPCLTMFIPEPETPL